MVRLAAVLFVVAQLLVAVTVVAVSAADDPVAERPVETVPQLDLQRYAGTWYEVARLPNRFQKDCVGDVVAQYAPRADGQVGVTNRCREADGGTEVVHGVARLLDKGAVPARLQVSFLPAALRWVPIGWGDYWVVALDDDYQAAAVSDRHREYLWVLSRTPQMSPERMASILERLRAGGHAVDRLVPTPQGAAAASLRAPG